MECPHCGSEVGKSIERGSVRVEEAPYRAFIGGEHVPLSITHARMLFELAKTGRARTERLLNVAVGPAAYPNATLHAQMSKLRRTVEPYGVSIRNISGWGYELTETSPSCTRSTAPLHLVS